MRTGPKIMALASVVALGAATIPAAEAASQHRGSHMRAQHHATMHRHAVRRHARVMPPAIQAQPRDYAYGGDYDDGFNPVAGILGAAATVATAPFAIATGGYPYGYGYYGQPGSWGYEGYGWPKRGPYYDTW